MSVMEIACPVDVDEGLARAGGEEDFFRELLQLMLDDVPPRLDDLASAIAERDPAKAASVAHAIKGAAANLAAHPLRDVAYTIEMKGRAGSTEGLEILLDRLRREFDRLAEFVAGY